jgi:hypothetical protein
VNHLEAEAI